MTTISWSRFRRSFSYARQGLREAFATENSFRIHIVIAVIVIIGIIFFHIGRIESIILILMISTILNLELVNTIVERFTGLLEPRVHPYVRVIKDLMAAAVLITSLAALVIGLLIFWPHL